MGWRDALRRALCFGTRRDTFHLGAVTGRGSLEPRSDTNGAPRPKRPVRRKAIAHDDGEVLLFAKPDPAAA
jgi:hypothetical protein